MEYIDVKQSPTAVVAAGNDLTHRGKQKRGDEIQNLSSIEFQPNGNQLPGFPTYPEQNEQRRIASCLPMVASRSSYTFIISLSSFLLVITFPLIS